MFSVFNLSTLTMGFFSDVFIKDFVVEKNNLVVDEYDVFSLIILFRWLFYVTIKLVFE